MRIGQRIKQVLVHADESGNDGLTGEVEDFCIRGIGVAELCALYAADLSVLDIDAHVILRCRARAIDDANVVQDNDRIGFFQEGRQRVG